MSHFFWGVSTPLVPNEASIFYYVTLTGISVGSRRIVIPELPPSGTELRPEGNMIIDSGSTLTELKSYVYNQVEYAVKTDMKLPTVPDPRNILRPFQCGLKRG